MCVDFPSGDDRPGQRLATGAASEQRLPQGRRLHTGNSHYDFIVGFSWVFTCDSRDVRDRSCGVFSVPPAVSVPIAASAFPAHPITGIAERGHWILRFPEGHCRTVGFSATTGEELVAVKRTADGGHSFRAPTNEAGPAVVPPGMAACADPARADCGPPLLPGHTQRLKPKKRIFAFTEAELCGPPAVRSGPVVRSGRVGCHDVRAGHGSGTQGLAVGGAAVRSERPDNGRGSGNDAAPAQHGCRADDGKVWAASAIPPCSRRAGTDEVNDIRGTGRPEFALRANAL